MIEIKEREVERGQCDGAAGAGVLELKGEPHAITALCTIAIAGTQSVNAKCPASRALGPNGMLARTQTLIAPKSPLQPLLKLASV